MKFVPKWAAMGALAFAVLCACGAARLFAENMPTDIPDAPTAEQSEALEQARFEKITDFLLSEYARLGQSPDWFTRSLTAISIARLPQSRANRALIKIVKEDNTPAVQLVAWECLLARAKTIDPEQFDAWAAATPALFQKNVFNGRLRIDLLRVMAITAPDTAAKKMFVKIFEETDSLRPSEVPVIEELGHTLAAWRSPDLAKGLVEKMKSLTDAYRAELVLKTAGCPVAWAGNRCDEGSVPMWEATQKDYVAWFKEDKDNWKEKTVRTDGTPWRELSSNLLAVPLFDHDAVRNNAPEVRKDLELGNPGLRAFDVMFVVDATESMQPPMDWIKADLRKMMVILGMMSSKPRIGITFYRDYYGWPKTKGPGAYAFVAKTHPLTQNVDSLIAAVNSTPAFGGGDDPEAVKEGLQDCVKHGGWDLAKHTGMVDLTPTPQEKAAGTQAASRPGDTPIDPKVIVIIGDAPPHPGTEKECTSIAKTAGTLGFKVYAVKLTTPLGEDKGVLPSFDAIAAAGNGASFAADFSAAAGREFRGKPPEKDANVPQVCIAKASEKFGPSKELLTRMLTDAVNVKYKERIEMVVPIFLEMCEQSTPEARLPFGPAPEKKPAETGPAQTKAPPVKHQQK